MDLAPHRASTPLGCLSLVQLHDDADRDVDGHESYGVDVDEEVFVIDYYARETCSMWS